MDALLPMERLPESEIYWRLARVRHLLERDYPHLDGLCIFSRIGLYYLTGTLAQGMAWVPRQGEPVLLCRRAVERARWESPWTCILEFKSFSQVEGLVREAGSPLGQRIGVEMQGLSWAMGELVQRKIPGVQMEAADGVLARARSVKSSWEIATMERIGSQHHRALTEGLPPRIAPGMTEWEIGRAVVDVFLEYGHQGHLRMQAQGEEIFFGHVSAGDSGNYPSAFNGPLGLRGVHPAVPFLGSAQHTWAANQPLAVDCGFGMEGYHTDKTQVYWASLADQDDSARRAQELCQEIQQEIAVRLVPGAIPAQLYEMAVRMALRAGLAEGFMGLGRNKVGFVGHGIGLAIDEWPVLAPGFQEPLEEGMTLAVEPKIGIPNLGMVGVEDTFVVTPSGGRCLTGALGRPVFLT
jgi:Xaa-Pro dipeptidase